MAGVLPSPSSRLEEVAENDWSDCIEDGILHFTGENSTEDKLVTISNMPEIREIITDEYAFSTGRTLVIKSNPMLERISIGYNCFTTRSQSYGNEEGGFQLENCAQLKEVAFNQYAFSAATTVVLQCTIIYLLIHSPSIARETKLRSRR